MLLRVEPFELFLIRLELVFDLSVEPVISFVLVELLVEFLLLIVKLFVGFLLMIVELCLLQVRTSRHSGLSSNSSLNPFANLSQLYMKSFIVRALHLTFLMSFESLFESFISLFTPFLITDPVKVIRRPFNSNSMHVEDNLDEDVKLHLIVVAVKTNVNRRTDSHEPLRRLSLTNCSMNQFLLEREPVRESSSCVLMLIKSFGTSKHRVELVLALRLFEECLL